MRAIMLASLIFVAGCAPQIQELINNNDELARAYQDQKELAINLEEQRSTALTELNRANASIQELLTEMDRLNNQGEKAAPAPQTRVVKETVKIEVPKIVPDGSLTATEEQEQYREILRVQEELDQQRTRAQELQQAIEAANQVISGLNDPTERYGYPAIISAILTLLGFIVGKKWKAPKGR